MSLNDQDKTGQAGVIRFAEFAADLRTEELTRAGRRVRLPRQSFQVLAALTRRPGELVTREQLQSELWPSESEVEYEQGLNAAINRLREALGDSAATPRYIETLPRRGYRFIGTIEAPPAPAAAPTVQAESIAVPAPQTTVRSSRKLWLAGVLVLAAVAASWWFVTQSRNEARRLVPFTALAGEERAPAFSPDGTRVVFAWNGAPNSGGFDLYVKALGSEQLLRLTQFPSRALAAAWSPDGTQIAFARSAGGVTGIYVMPALGGAERRLANASFPSDAFMQLAWSPDGKRIAYSSYDESGRNGVKFVDLATLAVTPLADAPDCWSAGLPAYAQNGERLAFVCATSVGVYGVYLVEDGKPRLVTTVMGEAKGMTFDLEDRALIVANDAGDGGALWRLEFDGALSRVLFGEEGAQPALARIPVRLAYVRVRQSVEIWRMDMRATSVSASAQRLIASTRSESTPQYSADGARIVFQSNRSGSAEIWMADASGANPVRLTDFEGPMAGAPHWCADGKRIAFDSRAGGISSVYLLDVDGRQPIRLGNAETPLALPVWSPDCHWILASDGQARLFRVSVEKGAVEPFTRQPSYYAQVAGTRAIFNVKEPDGVKLWGRDIEGGEEAELPGMPKISYLDAWAVAPGGVYFTTSGATPGTTPGPAVTTVSFYDFTTRVSTFVATLDKPPTPGGGLGIAVSPDQRWLLYTKSGEPQSDIMMME